MDKILKHGVQFIVLAVIALTVSETNYGQRTTPPQDRAATQRAIIDKYCLTCHTQRQKDRGIVPIALDNADLTNVGADPELWEKVVRKLSGGVMPPAGSPRPAAAATQGLVTWLESELDRASAANPNPGR